MADTQFTNIQRRLMNLYENGHLMEKHQLERAIDGLIGATTQMVKLRNLETTLPQEIKNTENLEKNWNHNR